MALLKSILYFLLAALLEIGGGWLVWQWLREHRPWWVGALGFVGLALYGVIPPYQPASFARTYAAYGGLFIVMSLLWGMVADKRTPDRYEWTGAVICLVGAAVIMYSRRG